MLPHRIGIFIPDSLSRKGYVKYYDDAGTRVRVYGDINQGLSLEDRRKRAELLMAQIIADYRPVLPLEEQARQYIESRRLEWEKKTFYDYRSKLNLFIRYAAGRQITKELAHEYIGQLLTTVSKSTRNVSRRKLHTIFKGIGRPELFGDIPIITAHETPKRYYQRHHIAMIKARISEQDDQLWFLCQCIHNLFIRPGGELRRLRVHHFDLDLWRVFIPADVSKSGKPEYVRIPKSFQERVLEFLSGRSPSEWLFPGVHDPSKPIGENTFINRYRKHMDALGFSHEYSLYSWKHTGAIAAINKGIHPKKLQIQLRHSSLEMTSRYLRQIGINDIDDLIDHFPSI